MPNASENSTSAEPSSGAGNIEALLSEASAAQKAGEQTRAYALYVRACENDDKSTRAWIGRAATAQDVNEAIKSWSIAYALDPQNAKVASALDACVAEKLASAQRDDASVLVSLARVVAETGHKAKGYALARRATELDPKLEEAWVWRGGLTEDPEEMTSCLRQALALNPQNRQARTGLSWTGSPTAHDDAGVKAQAEQSTRLLEQGQHVLKQGDKVHAHELFRQATELDAQNEQAWLWRSSTTADTDEALACVEHAIAINPNNHTAREARSWLSIRKLRESAQEPSPIAPTSESQKIAVRRSDRTHRAGRIVPLVFVVLALLVLVLALLYSRGLMY